MPPDYQRCLRAICDAERARPFVIGQLGQSLDGRIALINGESRWINNSAALDHLHRLRAAVDAVLVGVGTALADNPQLNVRRVAGASPARIVVDPRGRLRPDARLLSKDGARRIVVTSEAVEALHADVPEGVEHVRLTAAANGCIAPAAIVASLSARGLSRILVEGGAGTVSQFLAARALDRLHVLVAPVLLGSGISGLQFGPIACLADAPRPPTAVHVLDDGDVLFDCDLRTARGGASNAQV